MKKIIAKSALALAIATVSGGVFAGTLVTDTFPVKLAEEVFGTGNTTDGSETSSIDTLVATPAVTYSITTDGPIVGGQIATVKFTLDKGAVFGEDLSDINKWATSTAVVSFGFAAAAPGVATLTIADDNNTDITLNPLTNNPDYVISVDSGGAIGDNTVVFKIVSSGTAAALAAPSLVTAKLAQVKTKNLTSALKKGGAKPVKLGVEFRRVTAPVVTDTATAAVIFDSAPVAKLTGTFTDYTAGGGRARIDVADTEKTFTGLLAASTGLNASKDFDVTGVGFENTRLITLGTLQVVRNATGYVGDTLLKKENGDEFDFQGSDEISVTLTSSSSLAGYSAVYLSTAACAVTTPGGSFVGVPVAGDANSVKISLNGQDSIQLATGYNVCAVANGTGVIPEASEVTANLNIEYFNPRYTRSESAFNYGPILRNGCQVTLFNLPSVSAADDAFIRITNVSEKPGAVRVSVWPETGGEKTIDTNTVVVESLAAHATAVLHTNADLSGSGVYLGSKLPGYTALPGGRHRLVIQGAFPACEALGLVRASNGQGPLTNMTSTTYSGDETRLGTQNNGTSNTSN
ncbi:hypothetical protein [Cellvibrio mixtus]|uniref:hypothetical protein n=1 Tax=Cellvibrio mixtus TaxID=39650 RepID=UPI000587B926|nr:hypothetical protein [Cellvibrio mixtus]